MPERRILTYTRRMAIAAFIFAALLALVPLGAAAHVDHVRDAAPEAQNELALAPNAWPAPCPGGSQQSCACRSLAECPDGKTPGANSRTSHALFPPRTTAPVERSAAPAAQPFPASRSRAPPISS